MSDKQNDGRLDPADEEAAAIVALAQAKRQRLRSKRVEVFDYCWPMPKRQAEPKPVPAQPTLAEMISEMAIADEQPIADEGSS